MRTTFTPLKKWAVYLSMFTVVSSQAQVASTYTFSQQTGTYTAISGGTIIANAAMGNMDDDSFGPFAMPAFSFDGTVYTSAYVATNGHITLGGAPDPTEYTPLSGTLETAPAVISAFGADLDAASTGGAKNIRVQQVGSEFVVQWQNASRYSLNDHISFQIRLNSATNEIKIVYGTVTPQSDPDYPEVGIRSYDNTFGTNINNREVLAATGAWLNSTPGTSNASTCYFDQTTPGTVPASGTTFIWTPLPDVKLSNLVFAGSTGCYGNSEPVSLNISNTGGNVINFSSTPLTITASVTGPNPLSFPPVTINTGTLAINASLVVPITASYDMSVAGATYNFAASAPYAGDGHPSNNSLTVNELNYRPAVSYIDALGCAGQALTLSGATSVSPYIVSVTNSTALAIPDDDAAGVYSNITISGAGTSPASSVTAIINSLSHTFTGDLIITLIAPDGSFVDLANSEGFDADFIDTKFTDLATDPIYLGDNPFTGSFQPESPFSGLTGLANGLWKLHVSDNAAIDVGTLNSWTLELPSTNGIVSYSWSPASGLDSADVSAPVATLSSTGNYAVTVTDQRGCSNTDSVQVVINPLPVVTASSDAAGNTVCTGDSVTLTGSGATTYTWSGAVTDGVAFIPSVTNTYTVTGTDANGCTNTGNITVTVNALPVITASSDAAGNTVCAGDSVTLNGSGAVAYAWTGSVADAVAFVISSTSAYTVTGTDVNGCSDTASILINVNSLPAVTASSDVIGNVVCSGDSVILTGGGATAYAWTGSVTDGSAFAPQATNSYTVTGTDLNGCMNSAVITITVNTLPVVTASSNAVSNALCAGDSVTLNGGGAVSYNWTSPVSDGVTFLPSATTTYTVTGTDANGCSGTAMITITVNPLPVVDVTFASNTYCVNDAAFTLSGESPSGGTWSGSGVNGNMFDPATAGVGTVVITYIYTDPNGCSGNDTDSLVVNACVGLQEQASALALTAFPNPATETITLLLTNMQAEQVTVELTDMLGQTIYSTQIHSAGHDQVQTGIDIRALAAGAYLMKVNTGNAIRTLKVYKQ